MQQSLQKASFALLSTCDKRFLQLAVKSQVETKEMLAHSVDAIALAGHMSSKLSTLGREHLKPSLRPEFHAICANNATTISNLLFNLTEQIRDAKETNRLAKTVSGPSQQFDNNKGYRRLSAWLNKASEKHRKSGSRPPFLVKGAARRGKRNPYKTEPRPTRKKCITGKS